MYVAYDRLANAFCDAYLAFKLVMTKFAELLAWNIFRHQPEIRKYMDEYRLGKLAGETHIPREEKQTLQFLVMGNIAGIPEEEADPFIRLCVSVVKYGYLYQVLGATGADDYYMKFSAEKSVLFDKFNERIRMKLADLYATETKRPTIKVKSVEGYAPCLVMPRHSWQTGQMAKEITLEPAYKMPIFPLHDMGALQAVFAPLGQGKTFLMSGIACYTVSQKHGLVFSFLNDESNSLSYASIPLFGYSQRTKNLLRILNSLGVEPRGIPTLTLNFLRKNESISDRDRKHAPTIYDRIVIVDDPRAFQVDFNMILNELKDVAKEYGFTKPFGMVTVRNLKRTEGKSNIEAQITSNLLTEFTKWRKSHLDHPARIVLDEISYIAPAQIVLYASDALHVGATISDVIKESRRDDVSIDFATQRPLEILPEFREATNIFFRNLPMSRDKTRSQIDYIVDSLQLEDPSIKSVVREMNNRGLLGKGYWFWYHQPARRIEVVRPCPPTFSLQDKQLTARELFSRYEKETGNKVLLESWKQVKVLEAAAVEKKRKKKLKA